jgi:hypothetical protein
VLVTLKIPPLFIDDLDGSGAEDIRRSSLRFADVASTCVEHLAHESRPS